MKSYTAFSCHIALLLLPAISPAPPPPNIILFVADDMGMGDTSAYQDVTGNTDTQQVHTPNMERLARMGMRFTDAHTPSSRCTTTRYALLTGRYSWRSRMKYWVLYGSQGDPLIERDRPTIATLLRDQGYRTGLFGKWHVGLRYRNAEGRPAAGWADADLTRPLFDTPLDHGFDIARYTSRSHGTSGPDAGSLDKKRGKRNGPNQGIGPGHLDGRIVLGTTKNGKQLVTEGPHAYHLRTLGSRHSNHALAFIHESRDRPFFVYYPSNSNHGPYTPDTQIGGKAVAGAARSVAGAPMNSRYDFVYENDVALGRLLDYLVATDDPRSAGSKLVENTLVIFTSDNGAERPDPVCTGPFRSNKGSVFEGGHRVPFIVAWPKGGIPAGATSETLIGLHDLFATFAEVAGAPLPDLRAGRTGGEDSTSILPAWRGASIPNRPMFFNDHKDAPGDQAVCALRLDHPTVNGRTVPGEWKLFFDAGLLREGVARPTALYELAADPREETNRLSPERDALTEHLVQVALDHRHAGGHRLAALHPGKPVTIDFRQPDESPPVDRRTWYQPAAGLNVTITPYAGDQPLPANALSPNTRGLGIAGNGLFQVNQGEALGFSFDRDVIVASAAVVAGHGTCGGFYTLGERAPLAIYCIDADNDSKDQHGILSDLGVLKKGNVLRLDSSPHYGVEPPGQWRLAQLTIRPL